jgi:hypothetical protein
MWVKISFSKGGKGDLIASNLDLMLDLDKKPTLSKIKGGGR